MDFQIVFLKELSSQQSKIIKIVSLKKKMEIVDIFKKELRNFNKILNNFKPNQLEKENNAKFLKRICLKMKTILTKSRELIPTLKKNRIKSKIINSLKNQLNNFCEAFYNFLISFISEQNPNGTRIKTRFPAFDLDQNTNLENENNDDESDDENFLKILQKFEKKDMKPKSLTFLGLIAEKFSINQELAIAICETLNITPNQTNPHYQMVRFLRTFIDFLQKDLSGQLMFFFENWTKIDQKSKSKENAPKNLKKDTLVNISQYFFYLESFMKIKQKYGSKTTRETNFSERRELFKQMRVNFPRWKKLIFESPEIKDKEKFSYDNFVNFSENVGIYVIHYIGALNLMAINGIYSSTVENVENLQIEPQNPNDLIYYYMSEFDSKLDFYQNGHFIPNLIRTSDPNQKNDHFLLSFPPKLRELLKTEPKLKNEPNDLNFQDQKKKQNFSFSSIVQDHLQNKENKELSFEDCIKELEKKYNANRRPIYKFFIEKKIVDQLIEFREKGEFDSGKLFLFKNKCAYLQISEFMEIFLAISVEIYYHSYRKNPNDSDINLLIKFANQLSRLLLRQDFAVARRVLYQTHNFFRDKISENIEKNILDTFLILYHCESQIGSYFQSGFWLDKIKKFASDSFYTSLEEEDKQKRVPFNEDAQFKPKNLQSWKSHLKLDDSDEKKEEESFALNQQQGFQKMLEMVKKSIQGRDVEKNLFLSLTQDGMYLFAPRNDDIDEDDKKISEQNQKAIMNMMSQLRNMENIYKPHEATQIELISVVSRHDHINQRIELMNQFINLLENVDQSQTPSSHKFIVEFLHKDLVIVNSLMKFAEKKKKRKKKSHKHDSKDDLPEIPLHLVCRFYFSKFLILEKFPQILDSFSNDPRSLKKLLKCSQKHIDEFHHLSKLNDPKLVQSFLKKEIENFDKTKTQKNLNEIGHRISNLKNKNAEPPVIPDHVYIKNDYYDPKKTQNKVESPQKLYLNPVKSPFYYTIPDENELRSFFVFSHPSLIQVKHIINSETHFFIAFKNKYYSNFSDYISSTDFSSTICTIFLKQILLGIQYLHSKSANFQKLSKENLLNFVLVNPKKKQAVLSNLHQLDFVNYNTFSFSNTKEKEKRNTEDIKVFLDLLTYLNEIKTEEKDSFHILLQDIEILKKEENLTALKLLNSSLFDPNLKLNENTNQTPFKSISFQEETNRAIEKSHHLYKQISSYIYSSFFPSTPSLLPSFEIKKISQNTDSTGWLNYISWKKKNAKIYYFQHKKLYQLPLGNQIDDRINECYLFSGNRFENFQKIPNLFPFHFDQFHHLNFDTIKHFFENFSIAHKYATFNPKTNLYSLFLYRVCLSKCLIKNVEQINQKNFQKENYHSLCIEILENKKNNHYYQYYVFDSNQFFPEFEIEYSIYK